MISLPRFHISNEILRASCALAAIATAAPDLAVLDIEMPGISGLILSQLLRDQFNIPFVFFSALDTEETMHRAMMTGALAHLPARTPSILDEAVEDRALSTRREKAERSPEDSTSNGHVGIDSLFLHR